MNEKKSWGGKRPGSGRKSIEDTKTVSFRVNSEALTTCRKLYGRTLNAKVNEFVKALADQSTSTTSPDTSST